MEIHPVVCDSAMTGGLGLLTRVLLHQLFITQCSLNPTSMENRDIGKNISENGKIDNLLHIECEVIHRSFETF